MQAVAIETLGGVGPSSWRFLGKLGKMLSEATGDAKEHTYLRQRLSIAVQIGNSACIAETAANFMH